MATDQSRQSDLNGAADVSIQLLMQALDATSLVALASCSKRMHALADSPISWRYACIRVLGDAISVPRLRASLYKHAKVSVHFTGRDMSWYQQIMELATLPISHLTCHLNPKHFLSLQLLLENVKQVLVEEVVIYCVGSTFPLQTLLQLLRRCSSLQTLHVDMQIEFPMTTEEFEDTSSDCSQDLAFLLDGCPSLTHLRLPRPTENETGLLQAIAQSGTIRTLDLPCRDLANLGDLTRSGILAATLQHLSLTGCSNPCPAARNAFSSFKQLRTVALIDTHRIDETVNCLHGCQHLRHLHCAGDAGEAEDAGDDRLSDTLRQLPGAKSLLALRAAVAALERISIEFKSWYGREEMREEWTASGLVVEILRQTPEVFQPPPRWDF